MIDQDKRETSVVARSFPTRDVVLAERVQELLRGQRRTDPARIAANLETTLRITYPNVKAAVRDEVAGFGDTLIYVFRDGSAASEPEETSWVDDAATARVVTDPSGTYIAANDAAARVYGRPVDSIIGATVGTFTSPAAGVDDPAALRRLLDRAGRLHSLAVLRCDDGSETAVEFVTIKDGDGPGRTVTYLRERH